MPTVPKADETRRLGYRIEGGAALEVEGVCRFDESSVSCWSGEGKNDEELAERVKAGLQQRPGESNLQIRFGMKNRILIVRQTQMPFVNGQGDRRSLNLMSVGTDPRFGSGGYVPLQEGPMEFKPSVPQVRREARIFAAAPSEKETVMRLGLSEPMPKGVDLRLQKGASASLGGCTFTVTSIGLAANRYSYPGQPEQKMWSVKVRQTGKPTRPTSFIPGMSGMSYVDRQGKVVGQKEYSDWMQQRVQSQSRAGKPIDFSDNPYRPIQISMNGSMNGEMEIVTNVDPKVLGKVTMRGVYQRTIDVTGIPLDPR